MVDVTRWPLDKIMQLPDWCFGRRWWVGVYSGGTDGELNLRKCEEKLPDWFIVWAVIISTRSPNMVEALRVTVRLGDRLPADSNEALTFDKLLKGISSTDILYEFYCMANSVTYIRDLRIPVESKNRKVIVLTNGDQVNTYESTVGVLISSMPKKVPDYLRS